MDQPDSVITNVNQAGAQADLVNRSRSAASANRSPPPGTPNTESPSRAGSKRPKSKKVTLIQVQKSLLKFLILKYYRYGIKAATFTCLAAYSHR